MFIAPRDEINYDEARVQQYQLPDLLVFQDGSLVSKADDWLKRRSEIMDLFRSQMYGRSPSDTVDKRFNIFEECDDALCGKAFRRQIRITLSRDDARASFDLLIYLPKTGTPVPAFLVLNFHGNHSVCADPAIRLCDAWMYNWPEEGYIGNRATERSRGSDASEYAVEAVIDRGYAFATVCYCDIDPDFDDGFHNGIHALGYLPNEAPPYAERWGSIAGWAWGASRVLDYLETDGDVDATRVALMGHSRLGKTALWAGAEDPRFALVISNSSGCGGAALSRRRFGETIACINRFSHWFNDNFKRYNKNEHKLPIDQHMLIALMAPRPVYISSATLDKWADPRGEFLSCVHASPVYELLGFDGLGATEMPEADTLQQNGRIGYHIRTGEHDVQTFDWNGYLEFADRFLGSRLSN